jgi:hypothetical protein
MIRKIYVSIPINKKAMNHRFEKLQATLKESWLQAAHPPIYLFFAFSIF